MAPDDTLPGELPLAEIAARFAEAEQRVRELLRAEPAGPPTPRVELLAEALAELHGLRDDAAEGEHAVAHAYAVARDAVAAITGQPVVAAPEQPGAYGRGLGRRLAKALDRLAVEADGNARKAFKTVTPENVADKEHEAVTGRVDAQGARRTIGADAAMRTATSGRHATSAGTLDALPGEAQVRFKTKGRSCPVCKPHRGKTYAVADCPRPPLHPSCDCILVPVGATPARLISAMRVEAIRRFYEPARPAA